MNENFNIKFYFSSDNGNSLTHREEWIWLEPYINLNTRLRAQASNKFEKDFFKSMNNTVFGETMEDVRKRINVKLMKEGCLKFAEDTMRDVIVILLLQNMFAKGKFNTDISRNSTQNRS